MNPETDACLVGRAQHGDDLAFSQLVHRHRASVHRAARAILGSGADAEDVAQEAWIHAYMHLERFHGTASFKTWVHTIVRNRAIDHYRSARRRRRRRDTQASALPLHVELRSEARSPEELVLEAECHERLAAAVASLPGRLRGLLQLWLRDQHSYEEMAQIAGVPLSTIKSRIWQARQRVNRALLCQPDVASKARKGAFRPTALPGVALTAGDL